MRSKLVALPRPVGRALHAYVRSAPGTSVYLFTIAVTTWTLRGANPRLVDALLEAASTNLHNMLRDPLQVLVASAFWLDSSSVPWTLPLRFALVMVPVERWLGTFRWAVVFAAGHVGATLVTLAGIGYGIGHRLIDSRVARVTDVGVSYGFFAVAAVLTYRLPSPWRWLYATALSVALSAFAVIDRTFTGYGHLAAIAIGFACYPITRGRPYPHEPPWRAPADSSSQLPQPTTS